MFYLVLPWLTSERQVVGVRDHGKIIHAALRVGRLRGALRGFCLVSLVLRLLVEIARSGLVCRLCACKADIVRHNFNRRALVALLVLIIPGLPQGDP